MGAKTSNAMLRALRMIKNGATVYEASRKAKVWPQSVYNALKKIKEKGTAPVKNVTV